MNASCRHPRARRPIAIVLAAVLVGSFFTAPAGPVHASAAPATAPLAAGAMTLTVREAATPHAAIGSYLYLITRDDTGGADLTNPACRAATNASYPRGCDWASIAPTPGGTAAQLVTQGDQADFAGTRTLALPGGKYLISVTSAGHKIDGAHFTINGGTTTVDVLMNATPLRTATLRARIFNDRAGTNGELDEPPENVTCTRRGAAQRCNMDMSGFRAVISDVLAQVTTDVFGNPLCSTYQRATARGAAMVDRAGNPVAADQRKANQDRVFLDAGGRPVVITIGAGCFSDIRGDVVVPNLGPNRYAFQGVPPAGSDWIQTNTLEGSHDWDTWLQEGATGFDTERVGPGGELVPATTLGYVHGGTAPTYRPFDQTSAATGEIKGVAVAVKAYIPGVGGITQAGLAGAKIDAPVNRPWIAIDDMNSGDQQVAVIRGGADGSFDLTHVPDGDYQVTLWDQEQNLILQNEQVSVRGGQVADMGTVRLAKWFSEISGTIFNDTNSNGRQDPGEAGVPGFVLSLKARDNSLEDQGQSTATTDVHGHYLFKQAYPLGYWLVLEAYNQRFETTGYTSQADNQPAETTHLGAGVDVNVLNVIGLSQRVDWGVHRYPPGTNGGIVGTVTYDTTRNETDARKAFTESYQGGIPGLTVDLYLATPCTVATYTATDGSSCVLHEGNKAYVSEPNGSLRTGTVLNTYTTETWQQPTNCTARDVDGNPIQLSYMPTAPNSDCLESPSMGAQAGGGGTENFATVNGNYGFGQRWRLDSAGHFVPCDASYTSTDGSSCDPHAGRVLENLAPGAYLVKTEIPNDAYGRPKFQVTKEEDLNVFTGDSYTPNVPEPECAGALHTVNITDNPANNTVFYNGTGVYNPDLMANGGSPFQGQQRPLCDTKLVPVTNGVSVAPNFSLFTQVPLPGRYHTLVVDDLNLSGNQADIYYGEKAGIPNMPVGLYDSTGRLVYTGVTDANGTFDAMMPSTSTYNCPLPAGPCPNVYRFVANDPGQPSAPNALFNANYRTIATEFSLWPNETLPADLAPIAVATTQLEGPGGTQNLHPAACLTPTGTPQLFTVDRPLLEIEDSAASRRFVLTGAALGTSGTVLIDGAPATVGSASSDQLRSVTWTPTAVTVVVNEASGSRNAGPHTFGLRAANGLVATPGITVRYRGDGYEPRVVNVGPGQRYPTIQAGINAAGTTLNPRVPPVVLIHSGRATGFNPRGAYLENVIVHRPVVLQGYGPGDPTSAAPSGTVLDGSAFAATDVATAWRAKLASLRWSGNQQAYEGAAVSVFATASEWAHTNSRFRPGVDGMTITGADTLDFPNTVKSGGANPTIAVAQGGGVYLNGYARHTQISNVIFDANAGAYGGAIRSGTPFAGSAHNNDLLILNNRMVHNGGSALAGAIGLFGGTDGYEIAGNDLCGNFSAEYGGGISNYGFNGAGPVNKIHDNRIWDNASYDEGAGVMIAGELPANPDTASKGSGAVNVYNNVIHENLAGDDGGGIRLLQAGLDPIRIFNNQITDNVSTHEGGGIALDDATNVRIFDNTIAKNLTTATAATSNGLPAPAGLSTGQLSVQMAAAYTARFHTPAPTFSNPQLYGDLFNDNRAGTFIGTGAFVSGLSDSDANNWDLGIAGGVAGHLTPTYSIVTSASSNGSSVALDATDTVTTTPRFDPGNTNPPYVPEVVFLPFAGNINFISSLIVTLNTATALHGDYHLGGNSPARDAGLVGTSVTGLLGALNGMTAVDSNAGRKDLDHDVRGGMGYAGNPASTAAGTVPDIGMDEYR